MALLKINYLCRSLNMQMDVSVILPESWKQPLSKGICDYKYPVLWLLHGGGGDHTDWIRQTAIERYANDKGIAVVMPGVDNSGYMDMKNGGYKYFTYVSEDLPSFLYNILPLSRKKEDNFVAGLSMGGYGATKLMLHHPERYAACGSFSGSIDIVYILRGLEAGGAGPSGMSLPYGNSDQIEGTTDDNMYMFEKRIKEGVELPKYYISIGNDDFGYENNIQAMDRLKAMGVEFDYTPDEGVHDWVFWDRHIQKFLDWIPLKTNEKEGK